PSNRCGPRLADESGCIAIASEHVTNVTGEGHELWLPAKRESAAPFEALDQCFVALRRRNAAELRNCRNHPFRVHQQILVADRERTLPERRALLTRLVDVLLPHRQRL